MEYVFFDVNLTTFEFNGVKKLSSFVAKQHLGSITVDNAAMTKRLVGILIKSHSIKGVL